jgi:PAS domain S-box-containing protein
MPLPESVTPDVNEARATHVRGVALPESSLNTHDDALQWAHLAAVVESSVDAIVSMTLEGRVQSWNAGAVALFGYQADEMLGRPILQIVPDHLHAEEFRIFERIRSGQRVQQYDTLRKAKDGRLVPISLTVSPIRDLRGSVIGASKIARDISERKAADEAHRRSQEALLEADRRKDEFLALLAHELRNPLAPIRYALAASKNPAQTPAQRAQALEVMDRQVAHMSRLLDDLLDVSRITLGKLELKKQETELGSVLRAATEAVRPTLDAKQHSLSLDVPKQPVWLIADPVRLAQVFSNLLINAAKYTDAGGHIYLGASCDGEAITVRVRDDGIGIRHETLPHLFAPFFQGDAVAWRAEGGLGVGLSLVRGLTALHGGTVEALSEGVNQGSEFVVKLPHDTARPVEAFEGRTDEQGSLRAPNRRVLLVDDNRDAADTCATLLQLDGQQVRTAYSGRMALEVAQIFRPDIVVLDIGLPDVDGYEVATRIRSASWGKACALVAVTGWGREEDRQRAFSAGFDHHLTKPISAETLTDLLRKL